MSRKDKTPGTLTGSDPTLEEGAAACGGYSGVGEHPVNTGLTRGDEPTSRPRGGRKSRAEELGLIAKLREDPIPALGTTPESIMAAVGDVWRRVAAAELDRPIAESLIKLARTALSAEKQHHERHEVDELREMLATMHYENAVAAERQDAIRECREPRPVPRSKPGGRR